MKENTLGFVDYGEGVKKKIRSAKLLEFLRANFRPEFINRIDEIMMFLPIVIDGMEKIARIKLEELKRRADGIGYTVEISDDVESVLAAEIKDETCGVRELLRIIASRIENPLSSFLIKNQISSNEQVVRIYSILNEIKIDFAYKTAKI